MKRLFFLNILYFNCLMASIIDLDQVWNLIKGRTDIMLACTIPIRQSDMTVNGLTITAAGMYRLVEDITFSPSSSASAITINGSNILLDLQCFSITQAGSTTGAHGITVNSGLSNIVIQNGTIKNLTGKGIVVNSNCKQIDIKDVLVVSCNNRGIDLNGSTVPNQITNVRIKGCRIFSCCTAHPGDYALHMNQCTRVQVNDCLLNANGDTSRTLSALRVNTCTSCDFEDVKVIGNTGLTFKGFELLTPQRCNFVDCIVRDNSHTSTAGNMIGFDITGSTNRFNRFKDCVVQQNTSSASNFGFNLEDNSRGNVLANCVVMGNSGAGTIQSGAPQLIAAGFRLLGTGTSGNSNNNNNTFVDCIATENSITGTNSDACGWFIRTADTSSMVRCIASYNNSTDNKGIGILFSGSAVTDINFWEFVACQFLRNKGSADGTSFGTNIEGSLTPGQGANGFEDHVNLFTNCFAFNNGSIQTNQLIGVPSGSLLNNASSAVKNLSGFTAFWPNARIQN